MIVTTLPPGQQAILDFLARHPGRIFPGDTIPPAPGTVQPRHATAKDLVDLRLAGLIGFACDPETGTYGYLFQFDGVIH